MLLGSEALGLLNEASNQKAMACMLLGWMNIAASPQLAAIAS